MEFFGFVRSADIQINIDDVVENTGRKIANVIHVHTETHSSNSCPLFFDGESISGTVDISLRNRKLEHKGIQIEVIGVIELFGDKTNQYEFLSQAILLAPPELITTNQSYKYSFKNVNKPHESYSGVNVQCKYFLRVRIIKTISDIVKELEFVVHTISRFSQEFEKPLKMEVGIDGSLHIEFEYKKEKYHLEDIIVGKIYFMVVRLKIKHMELCIVRKESAGFGQNQYNEPEIVAKYDIMDGPPNKGEEIPLRMYLKPYTKAGKLTPTMKNIAKRFSVRYYLHLKLVDEDERTYYKQQEIELWRRPSDDMGLNMYSSKSAEIGNCNDIKNLINGTKNDASGDKKENQTQNVSKDLKNLAVDEQEEKEEVYNGEEAAF